MVRVCIRVGFRVRVIVEFEIRVRDMDGVRVTVGLWFRFKLGLRLCYSYCRIHPAAAGASTPVAPRRLLWWGGCNIQSAGCCLVRVE